MGSRKSTPNKLLVVDTKINNNDPADPVKSQFPSRTPRKSPRVQATPTGSSLKILGQDTEVSVEDLLEENGRSTPSSRVRSTASGKFPPRPDSSGSRRTPTPSKQISLQAVKRKEEKTDPIEVVDWNDFVRPVSADSERLRVESPTSSTQSQGPNVDDEDGENDDDHEAMVRKREQEMKSALKMHSLHDLGDDVVKRLSVNNDDNNDVDDDDDEQAPGSSPYYNSSKQEPKKNRKYHSDPRPNRGRSNPLMERKKEHYGRNRRERDSQEPRTSASDYTLDDQEPGSSFYDQAPGSSSSDSVLTVGRGNRGARRGGMFNKSNSALRKSDQPFTQPQGSPIIEESESVRTTSAESSQTMTSSKAVKAESSSSEDSDSEEDLIGFKGKAPNQLLMEFVTSMMEQDYRTAEKLCKMILIYEPENEEALNFYPLIQEKIQLDEEAEEESGSGEEGSDDSGEEEEDEDDDEEEEDDDDEDEDEDDEEDEDEQSSEESEGDDVQGAHPDSGIASANSD